MAIGKTNAIGGGAGGVGGILTVTAPANVTVSISKDGKSKTQISNAEGVAVFKGLETGTWTLTITDGNQTATKTVVITADYSTTIAFFAATITITYPAGSTCTCSDGTTTLTAPDTTGIWACIVPNAGTWTVTITDGTKTKSDSVLITADGQNKTLSVNYRYYLFKSGEGAHVELKTYKETKSTITIGTDEISTTYSDDELNYVTALRTNGKIDLSKYTSACMECTPSKRLNADYATFGVTSTAFTSADPSTLTWVAKTAISASSSKKTITVDLSAVSQSLYVGFQFGGTMSVENIWLE